jgi:hypothetical protein
MHDNVDDGLLMALRGTLWGGFDVALGGLRVSQSGCRNLTARPKQQVFHSSHDGQAIAFTVEVHEPTNHRR